MAKYRKKPVVIEAVRFTGENWPEIKAFLPVRRYNDDGEFVTVSKYGNDGSLRIVTLEGEMNVSEGDWIIKGVNGEFYPCKPDIFEKTYEPVNEDTEPNCLPDDSSAT